MNKVDRSTSTTHQKTITNRSVVVMLGEVGFVVAIPLIFFVFIGHSLDVRFGMKVTFLFLGIFAALTSSSYTLYTMYKDINQ